jgi:AcrR family transcriptional regulator
MNYHSLMSNDSYTDSPGGRGRGSRGRNSRRKERTRADMLAAARKVFAERGYHEASIAEITSTADVGVGTFYLHFRDKDEIFTTLIEEGLQEIREQVGKHVLEQPDERRLSALIRLTFHYAYAQRDLFRIALTGERRLTRGKFRAQDALIDGLTQIFEAASQQGYLAEYDISLLARFVTGIVMQGIAWWFEHDEPEPEVMTEQVMLLLKQGLPVRLLAEDNRSL